MDDALGVRDGERLGDARHHPYALAHREPGAGEPLAEGLARDPLHREVRLVHVRLAVGDVPDDPGVAQLLEHPRLAIEALAVLALVAPVEHLHRDDAAETAVLRAKHSRHAPGADAPLDLEALREDGARLHPARIIAEMRVMGALSRTRASASQAWARQAPRKRLGAEPGPRPKPPKQQQRAWIASPLRHDGARTDEGPDHTR